MSAPSAVRRPPSAAPAIEVRDLETGYGKRLVLRGIDLTIGAGEIVGVIGPNGSGKTTLLRTLHGALQPTRGHVALNGVPLAGLPVRSIARTIAVVPQAPLLPEAYSVADIVAMGRTPHLGFLGHEGRADRKAIRLALEMTDTLRLSDRPIDELSGGERQRVVLARALAQETPILFLDEPTAHLDIGHQVEMLHLVARLRAECNLTVLAVMHDLSLAAQFCPRLVLLHDGQIVADGPPAAVLVESTLNRVYGASARVITLPAGQLAVIPDLTARALPP